MMNYEVGRAKWYFEQATENLDLDDKKTMFAARAMQHIYYKMLEKIIAEEYDVYNKNIRVSTVEKAGIAVGVWAKYSLVY
jgi:phytoene synthase